jgi:hypothetical protein
MLASRAPLFFAVPCTSRFAGVQATAPRTVEKSEAVTMDVDFMSVSCVPRAAACSCALPATGPADPGTRRW